MHAVARRRRGGRADQAATPRRTRMRACPAFLQTGQVRRLQQLTRHIRCTPWHGHYAGKMLLQKDILHASSRVCPCTPDLDRGRLLTQGSGVKGQGQALESVCLPLYT
eukprot:365186-Chlamydomonas_euryale.AAC.3